MLFLPSGYLEEENLAYSEIRIIQLGQEEAGKSLEKTLASKYIPLLNACFY